MSRSLTAGMITEVTAGKLAPVILCELDFPSGFVRAWSGYGDLIWTRGSTPYTFSGVGEYGGISAVEEAAETRATSLNLSLSGIPTAIAAAALGDKYQGRSGKVWFACISDAGTLTADPFQLFAGRMDTAQKTDTGETSTITMTLEGRLVDLQNPRILRFTDADQQKLYPGDKFFQYISSIQNKELIWGQKVQPGSPGGAAGQAA